jgi:biotin transport system substrate-specific component
MLLAGVAAIYALGLGWLGSLIGFEKAVAVGLMPFIPAEVLKLALGTAVLTAAWKQAKR